MQHHTALSPTNPLSGSSAPRPPLRLPPVRPLPRCPAHAVRISFTGYMHLFLHPTLLPHPCAPACSAAQPCCATRTAPHNRARNTPCMGPESPWAAQAPSALRLATTLPCMPVRPVYLCTRLPVQRCTLWSPAAVPPCQRMPSDTSLPCIPATRPPCARPATLHSLHQL